MERALVDQANAENIVLIEDWSVSEAKTKLFKNLITSIAPTAKKVLAIGDTFEDNFVLSARNLSNARLSRAQDLSPLDIVQSDQIVFSLKGLDILIAKFGAEEGK
jgi:ribosomal protein L4